MPKNGVIQWGWAEFEELLQCPVCLDIPAIGVVEQCRHGHHICSSCKTKVATCPLCKCDFHGTRNFVVEELIRHFEVLKNTMLLNNIEVNSKLKEAKTKFKAAAKICVPKIPRRKFNTPSSTKGTYPCRAGDCDVILPASRLFNHVRTYHPDMLTEAEVDFTDSYSQTWEVPYKTKKRINKIGYVIFIKGMGLIFLTFEILRSGQLIVAVQMPAKFRTAQNFMACIELFSTTTTYSYNTRLVSTRDNIQDMLSRKLCYTLSKHKIKSICVDKKFNCKMRLSPFNIMDTHVLTFPNLAQTQITAGLRAYLVQEHKDKQLIEELQLCGRKRESLSRSLSEAGNSSRSHDPTHSQTNTDSTTNGLVTPPLQTLPNTSRSQRGRRRSKKKRGVQSSSKL